MKNAKHRAWVILSMVGIVVIANVARLAADPKKEDNPKPSSYASAADLQKQVDFFLERIETDLKDEKELSGFILFLTLKASCIQLETVTGLESHMYIFA